MPVRCLVSCRSWYLCSCICSCIYKFNICTISTIFTVATSNTNRCRPCSVIVIWSTWSYIALRHPCIYSIVYIRISWCIGPAISCALSCRCIRLCCTVLITELIVATCFTLFSISSPQCRITERIPYSFFSCTNSNIKIFVVLRN